MKIDLKSCIELYITNQCNLTCSNCNRFNNYDFRGHYSWAESRLAVQAWAQRITAPMITIIGGEPTLHPELEQWVRGAALAWPDRPVCVQTNGLIPLFETPWWAQASRDHPNIGIGVAMHSQAAAAKIRKRWSKHQSTGIFDAWNFSQCALRPSDTGFEVHDSDPQPAWNACTMRTSHTILQGKLYRCPVMAVLPQFQQQYTVNMSTQQQELLKSYRSLGADCTDQDLRDFVQQRDTAMPQCRLCPEQYVESVVDFDIQRRHCPPRKQSTLGP